MNSLEYAMSLDNQDNLSDAKELFHIPKSTTYLCGHSLGLQPKKTSENDALGDSKSSQNALQFDVFPSENATAHRSLLSGRVPDCELAHLAAERQGLHPKVDAYCTGHLLLECVVREAEQHRRLADAGISDEQDLEDMIKGRARGEDGHKCLPSAQAKPQALADDAPVTY